VIINFGQIHRPAVTEVVQNCHSLPAFQPQYTVDLPGSGRRENYFIFIEIFLREEKPVTAHKAIS
jgi:hypothetical protein